MNVEDLTLVRYQIMINGEKKQICKVPYFRLFCISNKLDFEEAKLILSGRLMCKTTMNENGDLIIDKKLSFKGHINSILADIQEVMYDMLRLPFISSSLESDDFDSESSSISCIII